ncbi:MAG: hypothetical protein IJ723_04825 [Ruminococcus sp.]|nr:hypothetical protein [Ruminococcus sp.]
MDKRFHKRAISAAAAVMTLTTVVTSVDAAAKNEITIESSKSSLLPGESFELTVGYSPDKVGASGFTIDLHYDASAVTLNVPAESDYAPDSKFALVTNFEYDEGTVRIVGADLSGGNVTQQTVIADLDFTVNDGYSGDVSFWTGVEDLVYTDGEEFVNAEFTAFGEYTPYTVKAEQPAETTLPETEPPTTTTPETTPEPETEPETSQPEPELPEPVIPPETVVIPETEPETEAEPEVQIPDEVTPSDEETSTEPETALPEETPAEPQSEEVLFEHKQGGSDFTGETAVQYIFSPYDYVEAADTVDIAVTVEADGTASGGIGMQTEDGWKIYSENADGSGETVWTAEDVELSQVSGQIAVQLYYLEHDSEFKITNISITSDGEEPQNSAPAEDTDTNEDNGETAYTEPAETEPETAAPEETVPETEQPETEAEEETAPESDADTDSETETEQQNASPEADTSDEPAVTEAPDVNAEDADSTTTPAATPQSSSPASSPAAAAPSADSNPVTGNGFIGGHALPSGIIALCLAQIGYSTFRLTRKEQ